jgi:hypothetical protein
MKAMRRILINGKDEFTYSEVKISGRHQGVKRLGRLFNDQAGHSVIISNTAKSPDGTSKNLSFVSSPRKR